MVGILPESKTGQKILYLSSPCWKILDRIEHTSEFVFPACGACGHLVTLHRPWKTVLRKAGLSEHWRVHDLRHAFASCAVNNGVSLPIIGALLGHSQPGMTQRYAHVARTPVALAAEKTAAIIESLTNTF